jgi:hypothetical protein
MSPDSYVASQTFGRARRKDGANGIVYESVRREGGHCVAVFRPKLITSCKQGPHICFVWDGKAIIGWYEKSDVRNV